MRHSITCVLASYFAVAAASAQILNFQHIVVIVQENLNYARSEAAGRI